MRKCIKCSLLGVAALTCCVAVAQPEGKLKKDTETTGREADRKALEGWVGAKPKDGPLEELLGRALKSNPDILVAEAKMREAEAELNRIRQQVLQHVVVLGKEIEAQKVMVKEYQERFSREQKLRAQGASSEGDLRAAEATLQKAKADLDVLEAKMPYLVGKAPKGLKAPASCASCHEAIHSPFPLVGDECPGTHRWHELFLGRRALAFDRTVRLWDMEGKAVPGSPPKVQETLADKIRAAMKIQVRGTFSEKPAREILELLTEKVKDVNIQLKVTNGEAPGSLTLTSPIPLGAALQWFEDQFNWRFVVRDYGIVAVERDMVPPGAILLQDFLKAPATKEEKK